MRSAGLALYSYDSSHEQRQFALGRVPSHRLLHLTELRALGLELRTVSWPRGVPAALRRPLLWQLLQALAVATRRPGLLYCSTEGGCLLPLLVRRLLRIRCQVVVASVALLRPAYGRPLALHLWRVALRGTAVTVYASSQRGAVAERFRLPDDAVHAVPLGVDVGFFAGTGTGTGAGPAGSRDAAAIVSVGSNEAKDFPTLLAAVTDPVLAGVRVEIVTDAANAETIAACGDAAALAVTRVRQAVPIAELRELYAAAGVVCVPLLQSPVSSGQTVMLEALAAGARVVVSDVACLADYAHPHLVRVAPGDPAALARALRAALDAPVAERVSHPYPSTSTAARLLALFGARAAA